MAEGSWDDIGEPVTYIRYEGIWDMQDLYETIADFFRALKILMREKPDAVIATGADVTVPVCYAAKLLGKKVIFSESFCRPYSASISGRLVYPIADLFIIQWKELGKFYPKAVYGGSIF